MRWKDKTEIYKSLKLARNSVCAKFSFSLLLVFATSHLSKYVRNTITSFVNIKIKIANLKSYNNPANWTDQKTQFGTNRISRQLGKIGCYHGLTDRSITELITRKQQSVAFEQLPYFGHISQLGYRNEAIQYALER